MATTVMQDAEAILKKAQDIIGREMQWSHFPFQHMVKVVQKKIQSNVYDKYEPTQYKRRKKNGGLQDTFQAHEIADGIDTIGIVDNRHETIVVESGEGYTWTNSRIYAMQPFPRPFYEAAEDELIADGQIENYLQQQLDAGLGV